MLIQMDIAYHVVSSYQKIHRHQPKKTEKVYNYVVDSIKYPVPNARQGFLPLPAQIFFQNDAKMYPRAIVLY